MIIMGYRSQVAIAMKKEDAKEFLEKYVKGTDLEGGEVVKELPHVTVITFDDIKWNTWYPNVAEAESFLNELEEKEKYYEFVRIGEDYDDVEFRAFQPKDNENDFVLGVRREIIIDEG